MKFALPEQVRPLVAARNALKERYTAVDLRFTFDGNLVGDLGEAVAAELFGLKLTGRSHEGIDGYAPDGRTVQVKASGTARGAAFRKVETRAQHLIFIHFDYDGCAGEIIYNGPEEPIRSILPDHWSGQRSVKASVFRRLNQEVAESDRLPLVAEGSES